MACDGILRSAQCITIAGAALTANNNLDEPLVRGCCTQRIKRTVGSHRGVQHPRTKGAPTSDGKQTYQRPINVRIRLLRQGSRWAVLRLSPAWTRANKPTGTYLRRVSEQPSVSLVGGSAIIVGRCRGWSQRLLWDSVETWLFRLYTMRDCGFPPAHQYNRH
jgi:hypothetical protein